MPSTTVLPTQTVDDLLKALQVLARTTERVLASGAADAVPDESLSASKLQILRLLGNRGAQTSSQIARFLDVSKPAVTQVIDSMVTSEFIRRQHARHDRREIHLRLTDKGKAAFRSIRQRQRHLVRNAVRELNLPDVERWVETLQSVAVAMTRADKTFKHFCVQCGSHADGSCILAGGGATCRFLVQVGTERSNSSAKRRQNKTRVKSSRVR